MNEQECLSKMYSPQDKRPGKPHGGVIQIWVTRACDKTCFGCTQGSNLGGKPGMMTPEQFEDACISLKDYWGTVGMFGGNPAIHPEFETLCDIMKKHIPKEQRGLWCNNPLGHGKKMRETFNPKRSNLNVHLDQTAYNEFKRDWPESRPFGLHEDSRHSPVFVAMKDILKIDCSDCGGGGSDGRPARNSGSCSGCGGTGQVYDEEQAWELISNCDINKHWSAMIGVFRNELRGWFCEIAGAQSMLHQHEPDYPDTGTQINFPKDLIASGVNSDWWQQGMDSTYFSKQVRKHCHECSVPLRGHGELAQSETGKEQVSKTHAEIYKPKKKDRLVQLVEWRDELEENPNKKVTVYLGVK